MLAFFLLFTVVCAMKVSNIIYKSNLPGYYFYHEEWANEQIMNLMGPANELLIVITIICAIICGLSGFFYLQSQKKVDLYHSMPLKREQLFSIVYTNGLLIYIIPYIFNLLLCFAILGANHFMTMEVFLTALTTLGINILFYCLIYIVTVIAVMLTGNIVISFLGTGVFCFYGTFVVSVIDEYYSRFFSSYFASDKVFDLIVGLSPIGSYINTCEMVRGGYSKNLALTIVMSLVITLVLTGFAVFLYKKRPSEAAGKAMVFQVSKPIIKYALVIAISLAGGIMFMNISNRSDMAWLIFGLIISLIISYAIIETIYNFDIRKAFSGKQSLLISAAVVGIIVSIFYFDVFGYDSYIPKKGNIKTMSVDIGGLDKHLSYYDFRDKGLNQMYISAENYHMKYMEITDYDAAYALAQIGIEYLSKDILEDNFKKSSSISKDLKFYTYKVKYTLNNGKEVYRKYNIPILKTRDILREVYDNVEFKKGHYPIYQWDSNDIDMVSCKNQFEEKVFSLDGEDQSKLLEIYRTELTNLSMDDLTNTEPIATLLFKIDYYNMYYYVYPSFTNTITFLGDHGFDVRMVVESNNIKEIDVRNLNSILEDDLDEKYGVVVESIAYPTDDVAEDIRGMTTYTDAESIKEIYSSLVSGDYYWDNYILINVEESIEVYVTIKNDDYGNYSVKRYYFREGKVPEFVKNDIGFTPDSSVIK